MRNSEVVYVYCLLMEEASEVLVDGGGSATRRFGNSSGASAGIANTGLRGRWTFARHASLYRVIAL